MLRFRYRNPLGVCFMWNFKDINHFDKEETVQIDLYFLKVQLVLPLIAPFDMLRGDVQQQMYHFVLINMQLIKKTLYSIRNDTKT